MPDYTSRHDPDMYGGAEAVILNLFQHPGSNRLAGGELDPETSSG
jgi:hypothetical protein